MKNPFRRNKAVKAASPKEIRAGLQEHLDYWDRRILAGDPLFDQWMVDAYEATKEALAAMDKMEAAGIDTGKGEIVSILERTPSSIVLELKSFDTYSSYRLITIFNGIRSEISGIAETEEEAISDGYRTAERDYPGTRVELKRI